jgi:HEPN domain-containing protein
MSAHKVGAWIDQAGHDEDTAYLIRDHGGHPDIGIYHLHQAAEKLLKALVVKRGDKVEKTHVLDALYSRLITDYPKLKSALRDVVALDRYYPRIRYPTGDEINRASFLECLGYYKSIRSVIMTCLDADEGNNA